MKIHGTGSYVIDSIFMGCNYQDAAFSSLWSKKRGDGGMIEGGLVFSDDLARFRGKDYASILRSLSKGRAPDTVNVGGPAVVALIHASQLLAQDGVEVAFYGAVGDDEREHITRKILQETPLKTHLKVVHGKPTPSTEVFDDPNQRNGKGERSFINTIGATEEFSPDDLCPEFYDADIILLGGTALLPKLHDNLHQVLENAKQNTCMTVVGTVYDFRHEKENPDAPWPLGKIESYPLIDLLVSDEEEAVRLTNAKTAEDAAKELIKLGVGAFIITRGALPMLVYSKGTSIEPTDLTTMPVSSYMDSLMEKDPSLRKDTTGCGDNLLGGVLVALTKAKGKPNMLDICAWGAASGGFACTFHGGTYHESRPGEKAELLKPIVNAYRVQGKGKQ